MWKAEINCALKLWQSDYFHVWYWSWNSDTLANWSKEPTHWKRLQCWERLRAGEGGDRGWDGWMASPTQWTWVWADSQRQWRMGKPVLPCAAVHGVTKSQTWLSNWTTTTSYCYYICYWLWLTVKELTTMTSPDWVIPLTPTRKVGVSLGLGTCAFSAGWGWEKEDTRPWQYFRSSSHVKACPSFISIVNVSLTHSHS